MPDINKASLAQRAGEIVTAYTTRDYARVAEMAREIMGVQIVPLVALLSILSLRRLHLMEAATEVSRLLLSSLNAEQRDAAETLILLQIVDGSTTAEKFLDDPRLAGYTLSVSDAVRARVCFFDGARRLTEEDFTEAEEWLTRAVEYAEDKKLAIERQLASADLRTVQWELAQKQNDPPTELLEVEEDITEESTEARVAPYSTDRLERHFQKRQVPFEKREETLFVHFYKVLPFLEGPFQVIISRDVSQEFLMAYTTAALPISDEKEPLALLVCNIWNETRLQPTAFLGELQEVRVLFTKGLLITDNGVTDAQLDRFINDTLSTAVAFYTWAYGEYDLS